MQTIIRRYKSSNRDKIKYKNVTIIILLSEHASIICVNLLKRNSYERLCYIILST